MYLCTQNGNLKYSPIYNWRFFSKAEQNIQGSESDEDCRSANDPKSQTIQPKRHAESLRLDPTDIRGSLCGWNGILSLSCQSQCLALAYLKRL